MQRGEIGSQAPSKSSGCESKASESSPSEKGTSTTPKPGTTNTCTNETTVKTPAVSASKDALRKLVKTYASVYTLACFVR